MDLSTNQELMGVQNKYVTSNGSQVFITKEIYKETDIKGNNIFNSFKTETNSNIAHEPSSLFPVNWTGESKVKADNSFFCYSSCKKAMDLRTHNRTMDGRKRTIFDDAEYFAKNYCYKLLPITFEQVDETIIQSEHNYSLSSLNSESEQEEDCSRTMDYSQIKEKNYKRRRTKFRDEELVRGESFDNDRKLEIEPSSTVFHQNEGFSTEHDYQNASTDLQIENPIPVQPLDLSASPLVQDEKTDHRLRERPNSILKNEEVPQPDSDKENVNSEVSGIRVTITRPDEKENYQPCDLFLNDIARLVPWLIDKDCFEVDILDRTCDRHDEFQSHRLYYVISEATWRLFQGSNERVILTNDSSLGQPLAKADQDQRPSYLVFDQFSLAKCLADYCKEIGGCFEYTCVEEGKDEERSKEEISGKKAKNISLETTEEVKEIGNIRQEMKKEEQEEEGGEVPEKEQDNKEGDEKELQQKVSEILETDSKMLETMEKEHQKEEKETSFDSNVKKIIRKKQKPFVEKVNGEQEKPREAPTKEPKKESRSSKRMKDSPIQQEPNNCRITTRSKSTSRSETSQRSDKPVNRKGRTKKAEVPTVQKEPPSKSNKRNKPTEVEDFRRKTRSGKVLEEVKAKRRKKEEKKEETRERRLRSRKVTRSKRRDEGWKR